MLVRNFPTHYALPSLKSTDSNATMQLIQPDCLSLHRFRLKQ